jgi:hypothetical protein
MRTERCIDLVLLGASLLALAACAGDPAATPRNMSNASAGVSGAGTAGSAAGAGGARAEERLCPASNLTRACICDDGAAGRQICIEAQGWGPCDCGQLASMAPVDENLHSAPENPPANANVAVTFDDYVMPKSVADCKPGRYEGTFQCTYQGGAMPTPFEASGVVSFALERSSNSEVLEIRDGLLDGWGGAFFFAYLNGDLTCLTGAFSGTASDGFYNPLLKGCSGMMNDMPGQNCVITDPDDPGYVPWTINLSGTYQGMLDTATDTIDGTWSLMPLDIGGSCDGTFTVTLVP